MTCIKSRMNSKKDQIGPTIAELRPLNCQNGHYWPYEQRCFFNFCWLFMKLTDNNKMHKISDEFENKSDGLTSGRVTSPWFSKWPLLTLWTAVGSSLFVESSWNLQIIMTCLRTNLKMGQIEPTMADLCPIDCEVCLWTLYRPSTSIFLRVMFLTNCRSNSKLSHVR